MPNQFDCFQQVVNDRYSCRAFLNQPVPFEDQQNIFALANQAPSNCNTQPWEVHVASGEIIEKLRLALPKAINDGSYGMDFDYNGLYEGVFKERQKAAAIALFQSMHIDRHDKKGRDEAFLRNFIFFDAPHVAFIFLPEGFSIREACDLGMYIQTLLLSMSAYGVQSCPQTSLSFNAPLVKSILNLDNSPQLMLGIAFGYEDKTAPQNQFRTKRALTADVVTFHA